MRNANERTILRTRAIDVNTAFKGAGDLTSHVNRLAINAQVASSHLGEAGEPFAILVRELITMARDLENMIENVESVFTQIVANVAQWDSVEKRIKMYMDAYRLVEKHKKLTKKSKDIENEKYDHNKIEKIVGSSEKGTIESLLMKEISTSKKKMGLHQKGLIDNAKKLISLISTVRDLTQKQSVYIAITARIESVRVSEHGDNLIHVSENISLVTKQIIELQENAESEVGHLIREIENFEKRDKSGIAIGGTV